MLDSPIRPSEYYAHVEKDVPPSYFKSPPLSARRRWFPSAVSPRARFRLMPPQECANQYLLDFIADRSVVTRGELRRRKSTDTGSGAVGVAGGGAGSGASGGWADDWSWLFDPQRMRTFNFVAEVSPMTAARVREELLGGCDGGGCGGGGRCKGGGCGGGEGCRGVPMAFLYGEESVLCPSQIVEYMRAELPGLPLIGIPQAQHHLMLDQPLAVVTALRAQLDELRRRAESHAHSLRSQDPDATASRLTSKL